MATTTPPVIAPAPTPAPAPIQPPSAPVEIQAWSPAFVLKVVVLIFGTLLTTGTIPATSEAARIAQIVGSVLLSLGFTYAQVLIKTSATKAYALHAAVRGAGAVVLATLMIVGLGNSLTGCKSLGGTPGAGSGSSAGSGSGLAACTVANLEQAVGNKTLLGAVAVDLLSGNYEAALAALAADVGLNEVNCAVVAFSDLESALETAGTGSGVTPKATNVALTNADAYIAKHGLRSAASK